MESYQRLECEIAEWTKRIPSQVVVCSSGTAALHLAFEAMRLSKGSDVIMSEFNMIACPRGVALAGLHPAMIDCDRSLLPDMNQLQWSLGRYSNRSLLATHVYGRLCNMDTIHNAINTRGRSVSVVEDMAEAHGCPIHPSSFAAVYSFYKNKVVHGEEGGCVILKDPSIADYVKRLRNLGFNEEHDYWHCPRGHNYRLSNCHAELIRESLRSVEHNLNKRMGIVDDYNQIIPKEWQMPERESPWVYDIRIDGLDGNKQMELVKRLNESSIKARMAFKPISMQPEFSVCFSRGREEAFLASREVIYLPLDPDIVDTCMIQKSYDIISKYVS